MGLLQMAFDTCCPRSKQPPWQIAQPSSLQPPLTHAREVVCFPPFSLHHPAIQPTASTAAKSPASMGQRPLNKTLLRSPTAAASQHQGIQAAPALRCTGFTPRPAWRPGPTLWLGPLRHGPVWRRQGDLSWEISESERASSSRADSGLRGKMGHHFISFSVAI